jgi:uncharacterized damage-inducible protein DinB
MFRRVEDFSKEYQEQIDGTSKLFAALTDQNLNQAVLEGHRTLGRMAWHLVTTIPEMMNRTGLGLSSIDPESPVPKSAQAIRDAYRKASSEALETISSRWTDKTLEETDEMYGTPWLRGYTLTALLAHETHHRGQMTVLLRQAGALVPGVFGPSKEEWGTFGMEAPEV